jgi:hypothetical protein
MPRAAASAAHAARIQCGGHPVEGGYPRGTDLARDREHIDATRLMWKWQKAYQSQKSAAFAA